MGRLINFFRKYFFVTKSSDSKAFKKTIYNITRLQPANISLYKLALQHSSVKEADYSNERLEFLGDAVLSLIIAEYLFKKYPLQEEGFLTEIRSRIVNRESLSELAQKIGIDALLVYDSRSLNRSNLKSMGGNALEAFIGAVYLDQGYEKCRKFIIGRLLGIYIDLKVLVETDQNYKSKIIAWAQKSRKFLVFELVSEKRIKNNKEFVIQLLVEGQVIGQGNGRTKKQAEQMAAQAALAKIQ
jgi:ribonuclease III